MNMLQRVAFVLGAVLGGLASGQLELQSPLPTGRNLGGAAFVSPTHAFVVGDDQTLLESTDGGVTWRTRMSVGFSGDPFYTITAASPTHLYIGGNNQDAYRSADGGATWTRMTRMLAGSVRTLSFVSPTRGFAAYNGALSFTPDGGVTWELRSGYPDCPITHDAVFVSESTGVIAGGRVTPHNDGGLYRTVDGGRTWALTSDRGGPLVHLGGDAILCVSGLDILLSEDAGATWHVWIPGYIPADFMDVAVVGESERMIGVTGVGDIWVSEDMGWSWTQSVIGMGILPADWFVRFADSARGLVGGANGLLYRTEDGGRTWTLTNHGCSDEVQQLKMYDDNRGMAVTHRGFVFTTEDAGRHWNVNRLRETGIVFGREEGLRAVDFTGEQSVVVVGAGGLIFRSEDFGRNWTSVGWPWSDVPEWAEFTAVKFKDAAHGWIGGFADGDASVFRTYDGGWSWSRVPNLPASVCAIDFKGDRGWICSYGGLIYRSMDGGETWTTRTIDSSMLLTDLEFADENTGWICGRYGVLLKSTNGGQSWTAIDRPQTEVYLGLKVVSPTEVWVTGFQDGSLGYFWIVTYDGGRTWTRTNFAGPEDWFNAIDVRPSGRAWFAGYAGRIVHKPAPPLRVSMPGEAPRNFVPGVATVLEVDVIPGEQAIEPGSPTLWVQRRAGGAFEAIPLEHTGGTRYAGRVPGLRCADVPRYYFSARGTGGATVTFPATGAAAALSAPVGVFQNVRLLDTGFEAGLPTGWTATGLWHATTACAVSGACGTGMRMYFGQDATCNYEVPGRVFGEVRSPMFMLPTLGAGQSISLSFCSALDTFYPDGAYGDMDEAIVWFVSGPYSYPLQHFTDHRAPRVRTISMNAHAGRTGYLRWEFDTNNDYENRYRGWHIDNVALTAPGIACVDVCPQDFNQDGFVDFFDYADFVACFETGACGAGRTADFNGDGFVDFFDYGEFVVAFERGC